MSGRPLNTRTACPARGRSLRLSEQAGTAKLALDLSEALFRKGESCFNIIRLFSG